VRFRRLRVLVLLLAILALPAGAGAKEPPNPNDPCSSGGRDSCGTTGVGSYLQSPFGIRWFGDYRGAVSGATQTFCIDLGYWYPSPKYAYAEASGTLRNRDNEVVSAGNQQRMAYAVWAFGRTNDPKRQGAVMLYVHSLMGDARPHEVDPAAIDKTLVPIVAQVANDSATFHGPYRIDAKLGDNLVPGKASTATIRVLAASGAPVPNLPLLVSAQGAKVAASARTNAQGIASVELTPAGGTAVTLNVKATTASTLPKVFAPTASPTVARNGQRLVAPDSQVVSDSFNASVSKAKIGVGSAVTLSAVLVGQASRDRVTITGPLRDTVSWRAYGPFPSPGAIRCNGTPAAKGSFTATGAGSYMTEPATFSQPGLYAYKETVAETGSHFGASTPCTDPAERVRVEVQPRVHTLVSDDRVEPGTKISDKVVVDGLVGQPATVTAALYGPYAAPEAIDCRGTPYWTGTISVTKDGEYATAAVVLKSAGIYVYRESIAAQGFVRAVQTQCADQAETSVAVAHPKVVTRVSARKTRPGASVFDTVIVTGLGSLAAPVTVKLWGPYTTRGGMTCTGTPKWTGSFTAKGDGTYRTQPVKLDRVGYYVFQESIPQGPASDAFTAPCADVAETTIATAQPNAVTVASSEVVLPGGALFDRIRVSGLGASHAAIDVNLYGPFASRAAVKCAGAPFWHGRVYAAGDGVVKTPSVRIKRVGFYTFREQVAQTPLIAGTTTECPLDVETALVRPEIITGRGDVTRPVRVAAAGAATPTRLRLVGLGIDAPISPAGIDVRHGVLGVPPNIHRAAWWADGAAPGSSSGAVLIAGHVDSKVAGAGAFFRLHEARAGDTIQLTTSGGQTLSYRVVSVKTYLKRLLPADVYSRHGRARLVVVTCGGPFDQSIGHYRDNIVVTAVPA
jgi:hypothetical protein